MEFSRRRTRERLVGVPNASWMPPRNAFRGPVVSSVVVSFFDWEIPELTTPQLIAFLALVRYQASERSFRIPIDVARLASEGRTADLERLHDILAARHAGIDDRYSLLRSPEWMLTIYQP
jgi:hypothetical protein